MKRQLWSVLNCEETKGAVETLGLLDLDTKPTCMLVVLNGPCSLTRLYNYLLEAEVLALISARLSELLMTLPSSVCRRQCYISVAPELCVLQEIG